MRNLIGCRQDYRVLVVIMITLMVRGGSNLRMVLVIAGVTEGAEGFVPSSCMSLSHVQL